MNITLELSKREISMMTNLARVALENAEKAIKFYQVEGDSEQVMHWGLTVALWRKHLNAYELSDISRHRREIHSVDDIQL